MAAVMIDSSPLSNTPAHNCVQWGLLYDNVVIDGGSQAGATITFDSGGTATTGTVIYFCGQAFATDFTPGSNDGYSFVFTTSTGTERAENFAATLRANIYFSPDRVTITQLGNAVGVTFNDYVEQSNWTFSDGGITQISFFETNGTNPVFEKNPKLVHTLYQDRSLLSLFDIKLAETKETAVLIQKDNTNAFYYVPSLVDYSNELRNLVATHLPSIYGANWIPLADTTFALDIYLRVGYTKTVDCQTRSVNFGNSDVVRVYNSLFQKERYTSGANLMQPYLDGALMLIKDRYQICRNTNFAVWTAFVDGYKAIEVVYYDANNNFLESVNSELGENTGVNYTNLGTFGNTPPVNCSYYIVNFVNVDNEVVGAVRFDLINCGCIDGELIFEADLGAYETFLLTNNTKTEITVSSDLVQGFDGCNVFSLQQGGRSIVNKQTEKVYTYETYIDTTEPKELEYVSQLLRSQSIFLKVFITEADAFFYVKIIPENTNFVPTETGKRAKLTYSFRFNQAYKSHPQNNGVFI